MTLSKIAEALGVAPEKIPHSFETAFARVEENRHRLITRDMIVHLQEEYNIFGEYYEAVLTAWDDIQTDENKKAWMEGAAVHVLENPLSVARHTPFPATDKTPAGDMLPLFALIPSIEPSYFTYKEKGFTDEQCKKFLNCYKGNIGNAKRAYDGRPGLTAGYFDWLCIYAKAQIFDLGGLNYEIRKQGKLSLILRNKKTGEIMPLVANRTIHRSGYPLGCGGKEDTEGSFEATIEETDDAWIAHPTVNYLVSKEKRVFSKDEWEKALGDGDDCIGIHIPRKTDFSPEAVTRSLNEAWEKVRNYYPELNPKAFTCTSWLLDPQLNEMLGDESKISSFSRRFHRYAAKSSGKEVFSFVFNCKSTVDPHDLPEETSLHRKLKKLYIEGEYIYGFTGVIFPEEA